MAPFQNRIHNLRNQPQPARLRAATWFTVVAGGLLTLIWLFVLLPTQLYLTRPESTEESAGLLSEILRVFKGEETSSIAEPQPTGGQVSGLQNPAASPAAQPSANPTLAPAPGVIRPNPNIFVTDASPSPSSTPVVTATPTPTPTPSPSPTL